MAGVRENLQRNAWQNATGPSAVRPIAVQALRILEDETQCDIIKVGGLIRNKVSAAALVVCVRAACVPDTVGTC